MSSTKTITAGLVIAGALGVADRADASLDEPAAEPLEMMSDDGTVEVDAILFSAERPRETIEDPSVTTIEEAVLASGLHGGQILDILRVAPEPFDEVSIASGAQQQEIHQTVDSPSAEQLHEALTAGLNEELTVQFTNVDPAALSEAAEGAQVEEAHLFIYDDVTTPLVEELVLAGGHEPTTTIVKDDPDTVVLEEVILASGLHIQLDADIL